MLVTSTLLALYVSNIRWDPSHPTFDELAALQFAAKAQESLILISLTDVILHRIRYGLLSRNGVPLGFLSSPFNIGFSVRYLISREFWAPTLNSTTKRLYNAITAAMVLLFALLGLAAGPSSAIAMIPRYDWWQLPTSPIIGPDRPLVLVPYTMKVESQHIPPDFLCPLVNNQTCVNQNLSTILQTPKTLEPPWIMGSEPTRLGNVTAPDTRWPPHRQITLSAVRFAQESIGTIAYAVTPMDFVLRQIQSTWFVDTYNVSHEPQYLIRSEAMEPSGREKWKQPLVALHCSYVFLRRPFNHTSAAFPFGDTLYDAFTVTVDFNDFNDTIEYLMKIPTNAGDDVARSVSPILLDIQHLLPVPVAASIMFAHSYIHTYQDESKDELEPEIEIGLCLVQARWVEADVWFYPKESQDIQSHLEFPISDAMKYMRQKSEPKDTIEMTVEWLRDIGVPPGSVGSSRENPAYLQIMEGCIDKELPGFYGSTCLPGFLAVYLANALSQIIRPISTYPDTNSTVIYNTSFEHLYAYGFRASTTLRLAFLALFLQVFIALIHLAVTVFARRPWHSSAWGNFGQMLTLALWSKPPDELGNVGAGVQRSRTWKLVAVVREIGEGGQLEMAVRTPTAMSRRGQTYAVVEEREAAQLRIPQVGTKYG